MSEEIKQKAREELRELFPLEYLRNEIDNFGYASLENWIDDLLSQALQKRDEEIIEKIIKIPVHLKNYDGYVVTTVGREELLQTLTTK